MTRALLIELSDWAALYVEGQTARFLVSQGHSIENLTLAKTFLTENVDAYTEVLVDEDDPVFVYEFGDPLQTHRWRFPTDISEKQFNYFWSLPYASKVQKNAN